MILEFFKVLAGSWPIAAMVIGCAIAIVVRRSIRQAMDNERAYKEDQRLGNRSVVVQSRSREDG